MEIDGRYIAINDIREVGKIKKFRTEDLCYFKITYRNGDTRLIKFEEDELEYRTAERSIIIERHQEWLKGNPIFLKGNKYE